MGLIFNYFLVDILATFLTMAIGIVTYYQWAFTYWKKRNVRYMEPSFPLGTLQNPFTRKDPVCITLKKFYQQLKSEGHRFGGMYMFAKPTLLVADSELLKNIMQKDFQYFADRGLYYNEKDDPLSAHLVTIGGQKWRNLRTKLTPVFTSGKMKLMFSTLVECSEQLVSAMENYQKQGKAIDIKDVLACFTTDVIGSCAFGLECNSFKNPDADFRNYGKKIFASPSKMQSFKKLITFISHDLGRFLRITTLDTKIRDFFLNVVKETVEYRERTKFVRKDFLQILMDLKKKGSGKNGDEEGFTIEELAAQAFVFFLAGFETSSTAMAFCLYELSVHPEIQERLRDEINHMFAKNLGKMNYESVMELKYLGHVVDETLRKYPPAPAVTRKCAQNYKVPGSDLIIEKGTTVWIPIIALHHDPEYYPDPDKFDPERFNDENKDSITAFTHLPFGEGPRICIGARFGYMQTKVGLTALLKNYKFSLSSRTTVPLQYDPVALILSAKPGIWLNVEKVAK